MGVLSTENRHLNHHKNILILVKVKEKIKYDEMFSSQKRNLRLLINQRKTWRRPSVCFQNGFWLQTCVFKYSWFLIPGNDTSLIPPHQGELEKLWFYSVFTSLDMTYNVYVHGSAFKMKVVYVYDLALCSPLKFVGIVTFDPYFKGRILFFWIGSLSFVTLSHCHLSQVSLLKLLKQCVLYW